MKTLRHAGIVVKDLRRSIIFYKKLLHLKIVKEDDESGSFIDSILGLKKVKVHTVKMASNEGSGLVELLCFESHKDRKRVIKPYSFGPTHIAFEVDNLDREYKKLTRNRIIFIASPQPSPDGRAKVAFCKDPDGTLIELVEIIKK